jgi:hypothetical protein
MCRFVGRGRDEAVCLGQNTIRKEAAYRLSWVCAKTKESGDNTSQKALWWEAGDICCIGKKGSLSARGDYSQWS